MISANRHLAALLAAILLAGLSGPAGAGTKESVLNACEQAIKNEFGAAPVEFGKLDRRRTTSSAFGELTLSDGSKAQVRCSMRYGGFLKLQFRGDNRPGTMWIDERPPAATYVEPKDEKAADKDAADTAEKTAAGGDGADKATDGKDAEARAAGGNDARGAAGKKAETGKMESAEKGTGAAGAAPDKDAAVKPGMARKVDLTHRATAKPPAAADEDSAAKKSGGEDAKTAKAEKQPVKPRFIKVPKN